MESRQSDAGAIDEATRAERRPGRSVTQHRSVLVRLAGAGLVVVGIFGLLSTPMACMFTEGIPDSWANDQAAYIGFMAAVSVAFIVIGRGVFRGREWARFLAIGLLIVGALSMASVVPLLLIDLALIGVLVFGWRGGSAAGLPAPSSRAE